MNFVDIFFGANICCATCAHIPLSARVIFAKFEDISTISLVEWIFRWIWSRRECDFEYAQSFGNSDAKEITKTEVWSNGEEKNDAKGHILIDVCVCVLPVSFKTV